ncbi:type III-B CRISPR module-associated protein Cmr5 [Sulfurisphaera ohwakuensis]|uniref:type III-B CRISPR module-associated protein Cmr5 n=1 Tax=Sulfurisphaera ohwakuensis TaxID=69656 RepID=UPI0036F336EB
MDYIDYVIEYGKKLENIKSKCNSIDAFVRRAEEFPSLVAQEGLVPALTFYYSKAEGKASSLDSASCEEFRNEGKGYSVYLMFIIDVLSKFNNIKCNDSLDCIRETRKNELIITRKLLPILIEMKKVANIVG